MFGEFEEMVLYHSILIKAMLGLLIVGMIIPFLSSDCAKSIRRARIYMFFSHGLLSMIAFSGLTALIFAHMSLTADMMIMIVLFFVMIMVEVVKYKKIQKGVLDKESCNKNARINSLVFGFINVAIIAGMVVYMVMQKNAVPVS
jgi:heme/copper-type cytochrome/quinol oxidase subunit 2